MTRDTPDRRRNRAAATLAALAPVPEHERTTLVAAAATLQDARSRRMDGAAAILRDDATAIRRGHPPSTWRGPTGTLPHFSPRESQLLSLLVPNALTGGGNDRLAALLGLSPRTIERYKRDIAAKLGFSGRGAQRRLLLWQAGRHRTARS